MKSPKVFTDFHHAGLLHSLILLFEGRLGGEVYRPIGKEWFEQGYWKVYDHPATVEQYLGVGGATPDGTPPLNDVKAVSDSPCPIYFCKDIDSNMTNRAITLQGFMERHFDIVIASIPDHIEPFKRLCEAHPDKPKLIYQIGNAWTVEAGLADNIMASAIINDVPEDINMISYHQEFDLDVFHRATEEPGNTISSFVNCFDTSPHFGADWKLFTQVEKLLVSWKFGAYGGSCRNGAFHGAAEVARGMRESKFIWHTKNGGDGYGHVIHNTGAVGRPLIANKGYYRGKFGDMLIKDGETAIVIDNLSPTQIVDKILYYSEPERYKTMCDNVYANFKAVVDFDHEQKQIEQFLLALR